MIHGKYTITVPVGEEGVKSHNARAGGRATRQRRMGRGASNELGHRNCLDVVHEKCVEAIIKDGSLYARVE